MGVLGMTGVVWGKSGGGGGGGGGSSKQQDKKFEILWFYNYRLLKETFCKTLLC